MDKGLRQRAQSAMSVLSEFQAVADQQLQSMKKRLTAVMTEIRELYNLPILTNHLYHLHSILMHSGQADSGHYYAYIYDRGADSWHKFSDSLVEVIDETEVMVTAAGGEGQASAYCFVYVAPSALHPSVKSLTDLIPGELQSEISTDNWLLQQEIAYSRAQAQLRQISELYRLRFCQTNNYALQ